MPEQTILSLFVYYNDETRLLVWYFMYNNKSIILHIIIDSLKYTMYDLCEAKNQLNKSRRLQCGNNIETEIGVRTYMIDTQNNMHITQRSLNIEIVVAPISHCLCTISTK